ncbi:transporter substrate-binding domain-containing protein [Sanguibacter massiliensis]|uniref:transporter substrate-binding domain-containing protein n=1 Tax=Sanguibacter massiliensis TaxID=1973217 RepID=UPI000C81B033|nr:transporter substrate-binding domain-containing protein [Sanguibacter massiliensis]
MNSSLTRLVPLLAAGALVLAGCSSDTDTPAADTQTTPGGTSVALVKDGVLTVCTNPPFAPFEYIEGTETVGLDMDITAEIAKDLGVPQKVITVGFDAMESGAALNTGQCDVVATGLSITDARKQNVDFSEPYFNADLGLLVKAGSGIASVDDLGGKKISVQKATVGDDWVEAEGLTGVQFDDLGLQVQALNTGQVEAAINDFAVLGTYVGDGLELVATIPTDDTYGLAVKKGNTALLEKVNATLARIKGDGTWTRIHTDRIGVAPAED